MDLYTPASDHALVMIEWCYGLFYAFICLQNCLNISDVKFMSVSEIIFMGSLNSANIILDDLTRSSTVVSSFYNRKIAVVIYNALKCFIFNKKDSGTNHLTELAWYLIWYCLLMWLCLLVFQACGTLHYSVFDVCIHIHPIHQFSG